MRPPAVVLRSDWYCCIFCGPNLYLGFMSVSRSLFCCQVDIVYPSRARTARILAKTAAMLFWRKPAQVTSLFPHDIYIHIYIYIQIFIYIYISLIFSLKYCCWCSDVHVLDSLRSLYFSLCTVSPTINWILTCCRYQTRIKHFQLFGLWKFSAVKLDKKVLSTAWKLGGVEVLLHSFLAFWHRSFTFKF